MEPTQVDSLVQRLIANPHDEEALSQAHQAGASDPKSYALLLERVGAETRDPAYASHWLSEAANVWSTTLGDAHRAARVLMQAIDRDPTARTASDRLSQLYRDKGDVKALVALLERRAKALAPYSGENPDIRGELAAMHEELGRLWGENLQQPKKAAENLRRAMELDPARSPSSGQRESRKPQSSQRAEPGPASSEESDPQRRLAGLRQEVAARRAAGDLAGATQLLARARQVDERDPALQQEYGALIVERLAAGENVPAQERTMGAELLVGLAEVYDGEHGLAYSAGALDIEPGHDRALQLYAYYARALQREDDVAARYLAYLQANPGGAMAADARWLLAASYEAAGQPANAIQILEPLRTLGDPQATAKLQDLYTQAGQPMPAAPPAPAPGAAVTAGAAQSDRAQSALNAAQSLAAQGLRSEALKKFREVLETDPAHPEALSWVEDYLRTRRDYAALRDVLLAAVRAPGQSADDRKQRLREVAALCESTLRDIEGAINAWRQLVAIDRGDEAARQSLTRLLEKAQRWDDLANVIEQEATVEQDIEKRIALEKKLANLHEQKRRDHVAAAEAWARIADLTPEDDRAVTTASKLFEQARVVDRAAQVIADNIQGIHDPIARGALLERLGRLREHLKDPSEAGEAYAAAAETQKSDKLWESAERCFVAAGRWDRAAHAALERAQHAAVPKLQAQHYARSAEHSGRANDEAGVVAALERATDLDPTSDEHAHHLSERYTASGKWAELVHLLVTRGDRLTDKVKRVGVRRQAAKLYSSQLADVDSARELWWKVLEDGDDKEALERLVEDAVAREDFVEATKLLRRLGKLSTDRAERTRLALREAELLAEGVGDVDAAIARYEGVLADIDAACRPALQAIADLQEARENPAAAVGALERELKLVADTAERVQIGWRLARLYERLDDPRNAIRALDLVREADKEDFDALARLCELCEETEQWGKAAELLAQRIEVEADEAETSALTRKLSDILATKLDRGDEALAVLTELADMGDDDIRTAYVELGDRLGWRGIVATKLVEWWFDAEPSTRRIEKLHGAFERFVEVGREQDAVRVACEIVRSKGADRALADKLEELAIKTKDLEALSLAHDLIVREMTGGDRARELVRQAEARLTAGAERLEAVQHGEAGLTGIAPEDADELLGRLAAIAQEATDIVDLYERQITRCRVPVDRVRALARAAQVASAKDQLERTRVFYDLALSGTPTDEMLVILEESARDGDQLTRGDRLRRTLAVAMAGGGQGARDGGRTRGSLMRRAASMAHRELRDVDQAFQWLGDSLIAHVDGGALDALEELADEIGDPRRAEETLSRALGEVFDGPLVRQLLARRAKLRRDRIDDKPGAAADLKKLHELSPADQAVNDELVALLTELGDYRAMVALYEDLILRGKDMNARAELARKVAGMWERELDDPREAADAWRRVLRMKAGDPEATAGLERAKSNMLRKPEGSGPSEPAVPVSPTVASAPPAASAATPAPTSVRPASGPGGGSPGGEPTISEGTAAPPPPRSQPRLTDSRGAPPSGGNGPSAATITTVTTAAESAIPASPANPANATSDAAKGAPSREPSSGSGVKARRRKGKKRPSGDHEGAVAQANQNERATLTGEPSAPDDEGAGEGEFVAAEDLAEMIDIEDAGVDDGEPKRSVPPPLPRG